MHTASLPQRAASFGRGAAQYHATRPGYPAEAVRWCLPQGAHDVLDLAAGTGKLTEVLVGLDVDVVAVEPSDGMRDQLLTALPGVDARPGTSEATGLPDRSVDAVTVAQAWHWFDPVATCAELARVLRPGGTVATLWNVRDHRVEWVDAFTEIIHRGDSLDTSHRDPGFVAPFGPTEHATFTWAHRMPATALRDLAASRSHLLTLPEAERDALLDEVDALVATHPDLRGRAEIALPYRTEVYRARLLA